MAKRVEHPVALIESKITDIEMIGVMETKIVYNKRNKYTRHVNLTSKHLADAREAVVSKADKIIDSENVRLGVYKNYHKEIRKMLRNHNDLCSVLLGNVNIMQHRIDLILVAHPVNSAPYRVRPKTRKLEQFKVDSSSKPELSNSSFPNGLLPAF